LDPKNQSQVLSLLKYHTIQGTVSIASIPSGPSTFEPTLLADPAYSNVTDGQNVIINQQAGGDVVFTTGDGSRSTVLYQDIAFNGGNLQIVDTLLVPPTRLEHTALSAYLDLSAFVAALYAANLTSTFSNTPDVTIFAPRMAAFQRLAGTLEALSPSELARLLSYHIVVGTVVPSAKLLNDTNLMTPAIPFGLAGAPVAPAGVTTLPLHLTRSGNNLYVNSAQVIQPDILIANGVVHMIDNVLDPNATAALPDPNLTAQPPVMPIVSPSNTGKAAGTPFASALPCTASCPVTTSRTTARATSTATGAALTGTGTGAAVAGPRCTGFAGIGMVGAAAGAGLLGLGVL
jgi:transforming growth factor-beta-induced protein